MTWRPVRAEMTVPAKGAVHGPVMKKSESPGSVRFGVHFMFSGLTYQPSGEPLQLPVYLT